jgi:hypothetical protein
MMKAEQRSLWDEPPEQPTPATMPLERAVLAQDARSGETAPSLPTIDQTVAWEATVIEFFSRGR